MTLSAIGDAETPAGGSVCIRWIKEELVSFWGHFQRIEKCSRQINPQNFAQQELTLKSRIRRRRAEVDIL